MLLEAPPGIRIDRQLLDDINRIILDLGNVRSSSNMDAEIASFHQATGRTIEQLRNRVTPEVLDRLVQTRRYWEIVTFGFATRAVIDLIRLEVADAVDRFTAARNETQVELDRWADVANAVIPDTNVFLHVLDKAVETPVTSADWHQLARVSPKEPLTLVLVVKVLDELDRHKRTDNRVQARAVLKELLPMVGGRTPSEIRETVSLDVLVPPADHVPLPDADHEIIDQASRLECRLPSPTRTRIITADAGMVARARLAGVDVVHVEDSDPPAPRRRRRSA